MKIYLGIAIGGVLLMTNLGFAKSKKRKHRSKEPTAQVEKAEPKTSTKVNKDMDLATRCMSYCEFTQECLDDICLEIVTVPVETCFNQCIKAKDLSQKEHDQTLQRGCLRTQSIYCQTGLFDTKCNCPQGPQAECSQGQLCNLPLSNGKWACGSPKAKLPQDILSCNSFNPCPGGAICTGIFSGISSGVCLSQCVNREQNVAGATQIPSPTIDPAQPTEK